MNKLAVIVLLSVLGAACLDLASLAETEAPASATTEAAADDGDANADESTPDDASGAELTLEETAGEDPESEASDEAGDDPTSDDDTTGDTGGDTPTSDDDAGGEAPARTGPARSTTMGPDGTHWPTHTPEYTTPATTRIASLGALNNALAEAQSGDVIEVASHVWSGNYAISSGNSSWAENVLVRAPLGKRQSVVVQGELALDAPHVTVAGFKLEHTWRARSRAHRSAYARMVVGRDVGGLLDNTRDFGLYEIVANHFGTRGDRMQIRGTNGGTNSNTTVAGSWLKGKFRRTGAQDHGDTIQTFGLGGGQVVGVTIVDSVLWASADKALATGSTRNISVRNSYFGECSTTPERPGAGLECPGYHAVNASSRGVNLDGAVVSGSIATRVAYESMHNSKAQKIQVSPIDASNNLIDPSFRQDPPPLANLDQIWD